MKLEIGKRYEVIETTMTDSYYARGTVTMVTDEVITIERHGLRQHVPANSVNTEELDITELPNEPEAWEKAKPGDVVLGIIDEDGPVEVAMLCVPESYDGGAKFILLMPGLSSPSTLEPWDSVDDHHALRGSGPLYEAE